MEASYKNGKCRSCKGPLRIITTIDSQQKVQCGHCGDTYFRPAETNQDSPITKGVTIMQKWEYKLITEEFSDAIGLREKSPTNADSLEKTISIFAKQGFRVVPITPPLGYGLILMEREKSNEPLGHISLSETSEEMRESFKRIIHDLIGNPATFIGNHEGGELSHLDPPAQQPPPPVRRDESDYPFS